MIRRTSADLVVVVVVAGAGVALGACGGSRSPAKPAPVPPAYSISPAQPGDPCARLEQAACEAAGDCHAVFGVPLQFVGCRAGAHATCTKPATNCDEPDPPCASLGDYRVNWVGDCHEGCVRSASCRP